jgi:WD40 repeat protein
MAKNPYPMARSDLAWQPNTHVLSIGYQTSVFYQINADTGKTQSIPTNHTVSMWGVSYAADGRWLATSSNDAFVEVWDTQTMSRTMHLPGFGGVFHPINADLFAVAELRSPHIRLWSVTTHEPTRTLTGTDSFATMVFSPNGQYLAARDIYRAYVWDLTTMERVLIADAPSDRLIFSPQSDRIAILNNHLSQITVVESATGDTVATLRATSTHQLG